jgi:hypothetical protein
MLASEQHMIKHEREKSVLSARCSLSLFDHFSAIVLLFTSKSHHLIL